MRVTLSCKNCSTPIGNYSLERPSDLEAILVLVHGGGTHQGCHELAVQIVPHEHPAAAVSLPPPPPSETIQEANLGFPEGLVHDEIECTNTSCSFFQKREKYHIPPWAVGAVTILAHSKQEGHVLRAWIDGQELKPL